MHAQGLLKTPDCSLGFHRVLLTVAPRIAPVCSSKFTVGGCQFGVFSYLTQVSNEDFRDPTH